MTMPLYEGSLFTWLDKVEQLTEENAGLTKTNLEQAAQIEMMRRGFKDIIQTGKQSVISYGYDKAHTRNIDTANGALTLSTTPVQALEAFAAKVREQCIEEVSKQKYSAPRYAEERNWNAGVGAALVTVKGIKELP